MSDPAAVEREPVLAALRGERGRLTWLVLAAGTIGGALGAAYLAALRVVSHHLLPGRWSTAGHAVLLVAVGVAVAVLGRVLGDPQGVDLLLDNIHVDGGRDDVASLRPLIPISLLCVGVGSPLGPEAPLVTTTGTVASWLAGRRGLPVERRRIVAITGMAAGFTVLFAAPLGSALFALEILHRRGLEYHEALLPAAAGALCGTTISALLTGAGLDPLWHLPHPLALRPADLAWALLAGALGAAAGTVFTTLTVATRALARRVPARVRPVVGGVALASLAFASPYALTNGEAQLDHLAAARVAVATLLVAAVAKLAASAVAMACGWPGGFIIPLFFVGFCLGRVIGVHLPGADPWAFTMAAMVAANVAVTKTPLGSVLVVTEMAGSTLLPTALVAALVALVLSAPIELIEAQRARFAPLADPTDPTAPAPST